MRNVEGSCRREPIATDGRDGRPYLTTSSDCPPRRTPGATTDYRLPTADLSAVALAKAEGRLWFGTLPV